MIERLAAPAPAPATPAAAAPRRSAVVLALLAVAAAVCGPFLARAGLIGPGPGETIFAAAIPLAAAALVMAVVAMRRSGWRLAGPIVMAVAVAAAVQPIRTWVAARSAPPLHDATTDPANPPRYVAVAKLRIPPANPVDYRGEAPGAPQRAADGELRPLIVQAPPARALAMAADTARAEGWTVLAQDIGFGDLGRLEATDTSFLFGRIDDIVVRIVPHPAGSRIDVRSSARDDQRDAGRNAARIRRFLAFLAERAAAEPAGSAGR